MGARTFPFLHLLLTPVWLLGFNAPPTVGSVTPALGAGGAQTFSATFTDQDGATDIQSVDLVFGIAPGGGSPGKDQRSCVVHYDRAGNGFFLQGESGSYLGPVAPGAVSNLLQTSLCAVSAFNSSAIAEGNTLTLKVALAFAPAFSGPKNLYLRASDSASQDTGSVLAGTWTVPASHTTVGFTLAPSSGSGSGGVFTAMFPDPPGFTGANPAWAQVLFATSASGSTNLCLVHYDALGNRLWLRTDDGSFAGPVAPGTDSASLQNGSCVLNPAATKVTHQGGKLQLSLVIGFKPSLIGAQNTYLRSLDATGYDSGFEAAGTWKVTSAPAAISLGISSESAAPRGASQTLSGTFYHPSGTAALQWAQMLIATASDGGGQTFCNAHYDRASNKMTTALDSTGCTIDPANSTATITQSSYFLNWTLQFKACEGFSGKKNVYLRTEDIFQQDTGFLPFGTITIP